MLGTGKYNFPGIRKAGARTVELLLSATPWGASLMATPLKPLIDLVVSWCMEWLANKGVVLINLGAIFVNGEINQASFDNAMDTAIEQAKIPGLSQEEKDIIDEKVKDAFRNFARISNKPTES